jgi:pilus assembly protein CpaD
MTRPSKENSTMRIIATSSLIALGLVLSGCSSSKLANQSVDSVNQPVVQRIDYVMDVNTSGDSLSAGEAWRE